MSKISPESSDSIMAGFDIFATPHTHTSVLKGDWTEVPPVRDSTDGMLEFNIPGSSDLYTDLHNTYLYVVVSVKRSNGDALQADADDVLVTPGDNFMHSLFASVTFKIDGQDVEYEPNYPHRAMLEGLLKRGPESKKTSMQAEGWSEDGGLCRDFADIPVAVRAARKVSILGGRSWSFYGKIRLSVFGQTRLLLPGIGCTLQLRRSTAPFCLSAAVDAPVGGARVDIVKSDLYVRKLQANPALHRAQIEIHQTGESEIKLPIIRVKTQFHVIPQGVQEHRINLAQNDQRPTKVAVVLVGHAAKTGSYTTNPFNFHHRHLSAIELVSDGLPVCKKYQPDFATGDVARTYMNMFAGMSDGTADWTNGITLENFRNGMSVYVFNTTGDLCDDGVHLITNGSLTLNLSFSQPTAQLVSAFVYQEKDDQIRINRENQVSVVAGVL